MGRGDNADGAAPAGDTSNGDEAFLHLVGLTKRFGSSSAVDDISLSVKKGEFVTMLGPSGCGKTTTLRMVAGFVAPDAGHIAIDGRNVETVPTHQRGAAMVFQNYALFPHMTVFENIAFGLRMRKIPMDEIRQRVAAALGLVRLPQLADRHPRQLSGGQQQRVALARAVVLNPEVLLLDEPLSNLDAKLRKELRADLLDIHRESGITTLLVTHDLEEAFSLSDRVAVMNAGRIEQYGTPYEIFTRPSTPFVADFVGHGNMLTGTLRPAADGAVVECTGLTVRVAFLAEGAPRTVCVVIPGHSVQVSAGPNATDNDFPATVERVSYIGPRLLLRLALNGHSLRFELPATRVLCALREGDDVYVGWSRDEVVQVPDAVERT